MADDKNARDKQADDLDRRQRKRDLALELERGEETEPEVEAAALDDVEAALEPLSFPATGSEVVGVAGDRDVDSPDGTYAIEELVPDSDAVVFEDPEAVEARVQRPTVAAAMKRVLEASETLQNAAVGRSQREAYEKTFRELQAIDADDDDEGIRVVADWIVEQIREKEKLPGSRDVRRRAAKFCRANDYEIRNDEWLGV